MSLNNTYEEVIDEKQEDYALWQERVGDFFA